MKSADNASIELSYEDILMEIQKLSGMKRLEGGGVEIYSGGHPEFGNVHIVVPPAQNGFLLLPFDCQRD